MRRLRKATLALPAILIAAGLAVPAMVGVGGNRAPEPRDANEVRYAGRTADEWHALAMASLDGGRFGLAIKYLKTAERAEPGSQYAFELARVRRERRRSLDISANRERMLGGEPQGIVLGEGGRVVSAHRTTAALPGESLWSLARSLTAAWKNVLPSETELDGADVYAAWDALTDMNGMRELGVGELVRVPLSPSYRLDASFSSLK